MNNKHNETMESEEQHQKNEILQSLIAGAQKLQAA